ncbi:MAG TPA: trigger factor [Deltaproteobacteria bacterium]|nr:trigger factor [Deltaproteobacteria bacterium]
MISADSRLKVEIEELSPVRKRLTIEVPGEEVEREMEAGFRAVRAKVSMDGFRKGKVPLGIIKRRYTGEVMSTVVTKLVEKTYPEAVESEKLEPVASPQVEIKNFERGVGLSYTAVVDVKPRVDVEGYRGMRLEAVDDTVSDEEVEDGLRRLREAHGEFSEVDRPVAQGDLAVIDFEGFVDGRPFTGGKVEDYQAVLGSGRLIPGFEEGLVGAAAGEEREVKATFPADYKEKTLAGREAVFKVKVKAVKEKVLPEIDDAFAKDFQCESLEALREKVRGELSASKAERARDRLKAAILKELVEKNPFEVPDSLVERYLQAVLTNVLENVKRGLVRLDEKDGSVEALKARYRPIAERQARGDIILEAIAEKEGLEPTSEETEAFIKGLAEKSRTSPEAMRARLEKEGTLDAVVSNLRDEKVFDFIIEGRKSPLEA